MSEAPNEGRSGASAEWKVRLECGHTIAVPWAYRSPAMAACVVEHRERCVTPTPNLSGMAWWAAPLERALPPAFR